MTSVFHYFRNYAILRDRLLVDKIFRDTHINIIFIRQLYTNFVCLLC